LIHSDPQKRPVSQASHVALQKDLCNSL